MSEHRGKRSNGGGYHNRNNKKQVNVGDKGKEVLENLDENNPVIQQFKLYAAELDDKHDRYERIVKISRDITIESKRIIFLLQTHISESKRDHIFTSADSRLKHVIQVLFKKIALELENQDPYLYLRAFRAGFQEFVEALSFYWYLKNDTLYNWTSLENSLTYSTKEDSNKMETDESCDGQTIVNTVLVSPIEFMLGIADLTGELMRKCINNLAVGDIASCFQTCQFVRSLYNGFLSVAGSSGKEINRKLYTLKQSLMKIENVCYIIRVRGSEIPKHVLAEVAFSTEGGNADEDESYQIY